MKITNQYVITNDRTRSRRGHVFDHRACRRGATPTSWHLSRVPSKKECTYVNRGNRPGHAFGCWPRSDDGTTMNSDLRWHNIKL